MEKKAGRRRRAARRVAERDYDRTADSPGFHSAFSADGTRVVTFDDEPETSGEFDAEFYQEQMPPHYGETS